MNTQDRPLEALEYYKRLCPHNTPNLCEECFVKIVAACISAVLAEEKERSEAILHELIGLMGQIEGFDPGGCRIGAPTDRLKSARLVLQGYGFYE